jgi:hypothetical protein
MKIILLFLFVLFLTSCASSATPPSDSGIEGQVLIGPTCPVVREGEECQDQPYQATLTVNNPTGERIVQIQTEEDGRFKIPLQPGEYILHPESPNVLPFAGDQRVLVETGKFTQIIVNFDSGIR